MRKKFTLVTALAFAAALCAGVAAANVTADAAEQKDGFAITATSVRLHDATKEGENNSGLRFKVDVPVGATVTNAYTRITFTTAGGQPYTTEVDATVWRNDNTGWNTVLLDIPESDYATQVTAQAFATIDGVAYETKAETSSIAKTAAKAMANGTATAAQVGQYVSAATLSMSQAQATMFVGDEDMQLTATVNPDYPVIWSSSNQDVVTIDQTGKVSVVGKGAANVTATLGNKSVSCAITTYEKYEIDSVAEFMAMPTGDDYAYCVLTDDINFAGTLIQYGATPSGTTYAPIGTLQSKFSGILDGNGYAIKNVNIIGNGGAAMCGCVFNFVDGTIKNLAADVTLTAVTNSAKDVGFIYYLYAGASVENCYIRFNTNATQYGNGNGRAVAAIATAISADGGVATIRNTIGVLDLTNLNASYDGGFGGAATIVGGNMQAGSTVNIENCYGVLLTKAGDTKNTAKIDSTDTSGNMGTVNKSTSSAYTSMGDMYVAAETGVTAENGWGSVWTVDKANGVLKFGDKTLVDVYTISSAAEFMAMPLDASAYCVLTQNIDFSGIIINDTEGYRTIGWNGEGTGAISDTNYATFYGTFNGNGHALENVTVAPNSGNFATGVGFACVFGQIKDATIKNVAVDMKVNVGGADAARGASFIGYAFNNCTISNCFVNLSSDYYSSNNYPVAPLISYAASTAGTQFLIENCVGVLQDIPNERSGGCAAGLVGRIAAARTLEIRNSYAVEIGYAGGDNATTPELFCAKWTVNPAAIVTNSFACGTMADMLAAATTGMTAANGWSDLWTVTADSLTFGQTVVYPKN